MRMETPFVVNDKCSCRCEYNKLNSLNICNLLAEKHYLVNMIIDKYIVPWSSVVEPVKPQMFKSDQHT